MARTLQTARRGRVMGAGMRPPPSATLPPANSEFVDNFNTRWRQALQQQRQHNSEEGSVTVTPTLMRISPLPFPPSQCTHIPQQAQYESGNRIASQMLNSERQKQKAQAMDDRKTDDETEHSEPHTSDGSDSLSVVHPHLLIPPSAFCELIHREMPDCILLLENVQITMASNGRCIQSSQLTQSQFDAALAECEGEGEVKGAVSGLGAFRFDLFLYSDVQVTFKAQFTRYTESPLIYIKLIADPAIQAANEAKKRGLGPLANFRDKPAPLVHKVEYHIQRKVEARNPEKYRENRWTTGHRLLERDVEELAGDDRQRMVDEYEAEQKAVLDWDRDYKQLWLDIADRLSPLVRPLLCTVDDAIVRFNGRYHITKSLVLPVTSSNATSESKDAELFSFRVDEGAIPTVSDVMRDDKAEKEDKATIGPIESINGARCLRVALFPLSAIQAFHTERRHVPLLMDDSQASPMENAETYIAAITERYCIASVATLTISHIVLDDLSLSCASRSPTAQLRFVLTNRLRLPFTGSEAQPQPTLRMKVEYDLVTGAVHPHKYNFLVCVRLMQASGSSIEVELGNSKEGQIRLHCADSRQACALYDELHRQSIWQIKQNAKSDGTDEKSSVSSPPLPLADCLARHFPYLVFPPPSSSLSPSDPDKAFASSRPSVEFDIPNAIHCTVNSTYEAVALVLVERITLQLHPESAADETPLFVTVSSPPNWGRTGPKQRILLLTPQLEVAKKVQGRGWQYELRPTGSINLRRWLQIAGLSTTLSSLPCSLQRSIDITGGTIAFLLDRSGGPMWQAGCASCGPSESDVVVHYQNWSGNRSTNTTWTDQVSNVEAALQIFVRVDQSKHINPQHIPYLLDKVQGRALAPWYHYIQCVMPSHTVLDRAAIESFESFVHYACEAGQKPWVQWLSNDTQRLVPHDGFVAVEPHLPYGQLLIPVEAGEADDIKMEDHQLQQSAALPAAPSSTVHPTSAKEHAPGQSPSLISALLDMHGIIMSLLDHVDSNSIIYGLCRVNRQMHATMTGLTTSLGADYWHHFCAARLACYCGIRNNEFWKEAALRSWRDQFVQRYDRKQALLNQQDGSDRPPNKRQQVRNDKDEADVSFTSIDWAKQSLFAHSPYYAAAVDIQCRFNTFQIRTMMQPAHLVVPQRPALSVAEDPSLKPRSALYPPTLYSVPEEIKPLLCITPPFCGDLRPEFVGDVEVLRGSPSNGLMSSLVPLSLPPQTAVGSHPFFLPLLRARPHESDCAIWALYTGPTYVWEEPQYLDGVAVSAEAVKGFFDQLQFQRPNPRPQVELPPVRPVRLVFLSDSDALLVTRFLPQLEHHLRSFSPSLRSFMRQKDVLTPLARIQGKWLEAAEKMDDRVDAGVGAAMDAEKVAEAIAEPESDERSRLEMENRQPENDQEESFMLEHSHICLPLMNALLNQYHMRVGGS